MAAVTAEPVPVDPLAVDPEVVDPEAVDPEPVDGEPVDPGRPERREVRRRIVDVAAGLLASAGRDAVTTRAVAAAAGVAAPTLYRIFGDKDGLLDAVAEHGFRAYLSRKALAPSGDPVDDLRAGWDVHVDFGLANPAVYALMYGDPRPGRTSPAADRAARALRTHVRRVAEAGRLRVGEDRAAAVIHAAGCGTVLTLLAVPDDRRDRALSTFTRDAVLAAITTDPAAPAPSGPAPSAVALRAALPTVAALSAGERTLLGEWLDRIAEG